MSEPTDEQIWKAYARDPSSHRAGLRATFAAGRASRDAELRALAAEYRRAADKAVHPNLCDECTAPLQRAYGAFADKLLALLDGPAERCAHGKRAGEGSDVQETHRTANALHVPLQTLRRGGRVHSQDAGPPADPRS